MREEISSLVYPVLSSGLKLKERVERGEPLDLEAEQAVLKGLLLTDVEARRWIDFGGEGSDRAAVADTSGSDNARPRDYFLGIRYALVCWLDEIFILDSPWGSAWNERKLEADLYGTNDRAWKFWVQAHRAESRPGSDAIEAFFLCVMLGFRGELSDSPERLTTWSASAQNRILRAQRREWSYPSELDPPSRIPPLRGVAHFQRCVAILAVAVLGILPLIAFVIVARLADR